MIRRLSRLCRGAKTRRRQFRHRVGPRLAFARKDERPSGRAARREPPLGEVGREGASSRTVRVWPVFVSFTSPSASACSTRIVRSLMCRHSSASASPAKPGVREHADQRASRMRSCARSSLSSPRLRRPRADRRRASSAAAVPHALAGLVERRHSTARWRLPGGTAGSSGRLDRRLPRPSGRRGSSRSPRVSSSLSAIAPSRGRRSDPKGRRRCARLGREVRNGVGLPPLLGEARQRLAATFDRGEIACRLPPPDLGLERGGVALVPRTFERSGRASRHRTRQTAPDFLVTFSTLTDSARSLRRPSADRNGDGRETARTRCRLDPILVDPCLNVRGTNANA